MGTGLGHLLLFISRKAPAARPAPRFLSDLSLFFETVLLTLVCGSNDASSVSVCMGVFFLFYDLGFLVFVCCCCHYIYWLLFREAKVRVLYVRL